MECPKGCNCKGLGAHRRLRGDRAASPSGLSRFASSQSGISLRAALHDYRGLLAFLFIFALAVMA